MEEKENLKDIYYLFGYEYLNPYRFENGKYYDKYGQLLNDDKNLNDDEYTTFFREGDDYHKFLVDYNLPTSNRTNYITFVKLRNAIKTGNRRRPVDYQRRILTRQLPATLDEDGNPAFQTRLAPRTIPYSEDQERIETLQRQLDILMKRGIGTEEDRLEIRRLEREVRRIQEKIEEEKIKNRPGSLVIIPVQPLASLEDRIRYNRLIGRDIQTLRSRTRNLTEQELLALETIEESKRYDIDDDDF